MSGLTKKVKAFDPPSRYQDEAKEKGYPGAIPKVTLQPWWHNNNRVVPSPEYVSPKTCL